NDSWLTISSGGTGTGNGTVTYAVAANTGTSPRTGTLTVGGVIVTVTQAGAAASCTYSISPTSTTVTNQAITKSVTVAATAGCSWTAVSNVSWITITGGASGTGNGTVTYSVAAYIGTQIRVGTMTIAGKTFTIYQTP
ncbi:MAG: BACON domain-containing protein, partial [Acidobacteriota bacterium]